jgi:prephenate dehydratase
MSATTIAFLGPEGTFAHLAAKHRYGKQGKLLPIPSIKGVFDYVSAGKNRLGIVPIENSSGGTIRETVEGLTGKYNGISIHESLSVNVRLALLGRNKKSIKVIYSHFAPLHHCENWIRANYPNAELIAQPSTATAVQKAVAQKDAAAIGNKEAAKTYNLKVLEFPIEQDSKNVTQFFVMGQGIGKKATTGEIRTSLVAALPNKPGSLCDFLEAFKNYGVNLNRLISQPVIGSPETYVFLVDVSGSESDKHVRNALKDANAVSLFIKNMGSYPVHPPYNS